MTALERTLAKPTTPNGPCGWCYRRYALNADGTIRGHRFPDGNPCPGASAKPWTPKPRTSRVSAARHRADLENAIRQPARPDNPRP